MTDDTVKVVPMHVRLDYTVTAGTTYSRFLLQLAKKRCGAVRVAR